ATEAACKIEILRSWKAKALAATGDHTAARDLLARRWPAEFGPHETRTVHQSGDIGVTAVHVLSVPDLGRMRSLLDLPAPGQLGQLAGLLGMVASEEAPDVLPGHAVEVPISSK